MGNYRPFLQGPLPVANYTRIIIPGRFWTRPPSTKSTRMASSATPLHDSLIELAIPDAHAHAIKWYLKVEFPVESLLHSPGNIHFWNLLSFLILKHYLSIKFGWSECLQEIVYYATFLYHFSLCKCTYKILPILQTSGITTIGSSAGDRIGGASTVYVYMHKFMHGSILCT